jgi:hypothetical protein
MKPRNKCGFETPKMDKFERESSEIACLKTVKINWFHLVGRFWQSSWSEKQMSIRVGLYDFFAYTLLGIFYLIIIGFWLKTVGLLVVNFSTTNDFSLIVLFVFVGAGYITGLLIDSLSYRWVNIP